MLADRVGQGVLQFLRHVGSGWQFALHPFALVEFHRGFLPLLPHVAGREEPHIVAMGHDGLHLRGNPEPSLAIRSVVQGDDADGVARNDPMVLAGVVQHEGVHAGQVLDQAGTFGAVEGEDDLAIAAGLVGVPLGQRPFADVLVVVDLAVDRQDGLRFGVDHGLRSAQDVHDGQALMGDDGTGMFADARPVWSPVPLAQAGLQHELAVPGVFSRSVEQGGNRTHGGE